MLEIYFKTVRDIEFKQIQDVRPGSWIYARDATQEDLVKIAEITGIELNDLRDSLDRFELPRIERIGDTILCFTRYPAEIEFGLYTDTLTIILTNAYVIAISPGRSEMIEHLIASSTPLGTTQKAKLILHILLKISVDYTANIKRVRHAILDHEKSMKIIDNKTISILTKNEEILNQYLTSLIPLRNTLTAIAEGRYITLHEKDADLLQDLMIAIHQSEDVCGVNIKSIRSLRDSYQIIFTNNVNRTIKLLTALTIVFHIPTIVASIYGMNINIPLQRSPFAFWYFIGVTIFASFVAVLLFRRNRWL
jgi:magnesium transporter